ncbi:DUF6520 family protein [Sinomicrobium oceani]|uniref:DUF6520 family protein n=1 Tax=Sinomicrobium oceani TaxID=1150368 RepID=UPI00227BEF11|nr:DUF6520 family protein [Sinomicrobium oceani]
MKTKSLKLILSGSVCTLAVALAFASNVYSENAFVPETGYIETEVPCDTPVQCDTQEGELCTVIQNGVEVQAFGKENPSSTDCTVELYRP